MAQPVFSSEPVEVNDNVNQDVAIPIVVPQQTKDD